MNITIKTETLEEVLRQMYRCDCHGELTWLERKQDDALGFFVLCNDLFGPCADLEEITDENAHLLRESVDDLDRIGGHWMATLYAPSLFCIRARGAAPWSHRLRGMRKYLEEFGKFSPEQINEAMVLLGESAK